MHERSFWLLHGKYDPVQEFKQRCCCSRAFFLFFFSDFAVDNRWGPHRRLNLIVALVENLYLIRIFCFDPLIHSGERCLDLMASDQVLLCRVIVRWSVISISNDNSIHSSVYLNHFKISAYSSTDTEKGQVFDGRQTNCCLFDGAVKRLPTAH